MKDDWAYEKLDEGDQEIVDKIAYWYSVVSQYAHFQELTPSYLKQNNGRLANNLSMLFKRNNIQSIPYYHFEDVLNLVDNWVNKKIRNSEQLASISSVINMALNDVNNLLESFEEGAMTNKESCDFEGAPLIIVSQANAAHLVHEIVQLDKRGMSTPEFRGILRRKIDQEMKNVKRHDFGSANDFGTDFFKGLE